jgi:threonine aldolase
MNQLKIHKNSHIMHYELSSVAAIAGAMPIAVDGERGILTPKELEKHLRPDIYYMSKVKMIEIENSHNKEGGTCYKLNELKAVSEFAKKNNLKVHMDGARMFNASAATTIPVKKMCSFVDTVTFCLSKGLGAPVGSILCGSEKFIEEARRVRKMLGGGMRQAGVLAAAGIYALEKNIKILELDMVNAKRIAKSLSLVTWAKIDLKTVETNILYFSTFQKADIVVSALGTLTVLDSASNVSLDNAPAVQENVDTASGHVSITIKEQEQLLIDRVNQILEITKQENYDPKNPPIEKKKLDISECKSLEEVEKKGLALEHKMYSEVLKSLFVYK